MSIRTGADNSGRYITTEYGDVAVTGEYRCATVLHGTTNDRTYPCAIENDMGVAVEVTDRTTAPGIGPMTTDNGLVLPFIGANPYIANIGYSVAVVRKPCTTINYHIGITAGQTCRSTVKEQFPGLRSNGSSLQTCRCTGQTGGSPVDIPIGIQLSTTGYYQFPIAIIVDKLILVAVQARNGDKSRIHTRGNTELKLQIPGEIQIEAIHGHSGGKGINLNQITTRYIAVGQ